jgi:hypothetical protein
MISGEGAGSGPRNIINYVDYGTGTLHKERTKEPTIEQVVGVLNIKILLNVICIT